MEVLDQLATLQTDLPNIVIRGSAAIRRAQVEAVRIICFGPLAAVALLWVAFYNGYPTVFPDTGSYLFTGVYHIALWPYRSPAYSVFTRWSSLGISAWLIVAVQASIVVCVVYEACDYFAKGDRSLRDQSLLATVGVLAGLTSLPWQVSLLMPDVFAGLSFLSAFLLAFANELSIARRIFLAAILLISVAVHTSLFPIVGLYTVALIALTFARRKTDRRIVARSVAGWLLVPFLVAGILTATLNAQMGAGFSLSPAKNAFLLGRLFGDGLAADFLRESCPRRPFIACQYISNLPRNEEDFLFRHPLGQKLQGHEGEVESIAHGTIRRYPAQFLMSSAKQTLLQLVALRTGDEMRTASVTEWNREVMNRLFPGDMLAFRNGRQFLGRMSALTKIDSRVHTVTFWLSLAACLLFALTERFPAVNNLLISAGLFLIINAACCGSLSGVYDRYQSRVAWLLPFCFTTYLSCFLKQMRRRRATLTEPQIGQGQSRA